MAKINDDSKLDKVDDEHTSVATDNEDESSVTTVDTLDELIEKLSALRDQIGGKSRPIMVVSYAPPEVEESENSKESENKGDSEEEDYDMYLEIHGIEVMEDDSGNKVVGLIHEAEEDDEEDGEEDEQEPIDDNK
jgi:hypothetical protein